MSEGSGDVRRLPIIPRDVYGKSRKENVHDMDREDGKNSLNNQRECSE